MTPTVVRLDVAFAAIVSAAAGMCEAARAEDGLLEGISSVVTGDRARARPVSPYLWVAIGAATATNTRTLHETWNVSLMLNAFVSSDNPEDGWMDAFVWAAKASSVVLADRSLNLDYVSDVRRVALEPLGHLKESKRFGAFARLDVTANIRETQPTS